MKVLVRGRNVDVTSALKEYVEKRVGKLTKFLDDVDEATVILVVEGDSHKVEVTVPFNGMILRGEEATGDMYASIDLVVDKLEKQIEKYKGKLARRRGAGEQKAAAGVPLPGGEEEGPTVVKTKRFAIKPMPVEEAVLQMNLLGHNFFVFSNAETEQVNVVYKRKDGNYGLIEPEF
ncbi:ribosome-associated translation inhibitor RaiA [Desulfallas sp. Bu1-1]|jgi:putative sigma-54 modulation protein|uniref:ribosome hibernation-promoting factor, HPF/YfiA family n=1 Tax=Desulfallas sp. Bu1-1 TaxID=2787620 RepID=UPI00189DBA2E|nr:ribosome-associated translation inhibitor RaiA [Desulfallas sp. Bu1-1]MBF7081636.1 ribosome-associated translation inhibitor RaiA [Desulfallas sp. Bu1-1]